MEEPIFEHCLQYSPLLHDIILYNYNLIYTTLLHSQINSNYL